MRQRAFRWIRVVLIALVFSIVSGARAGQPAAGKAFLLAESAEAGEDPYLQYIRQAPEFQRIAQDPKVMRGRWNTWLYMPWRYQWSIGTGDEGGRFCREYGFNGGFTDHGEGPLDWLEKWNLRFYNDHTASKGYLYLHGANMA